MPDAFKVVCPHCSQHLRSKKPVVPGQHAHCPGCGASFTVHHVAASAPVAVCGPLWNRRTAWAAAGFGAVAVAAGLAVGLLWPSPHHGPAPAPAGGQPQPGAAAGKAPPKEWLSPERQAQVDVAVARGVEFLENAQQEDGGWGDYHPAGLASLAALALLECGVPADDARMGRALKYVRAAVPRLDSTYELALALLLLERRGDPEDRPRVQSLALRLMAGQTAAGGWSYQCPPLTPAQERDLLPLLEELRPASHKDLFPQDAAAPAEGAGKPKPQEFKGKAGETYAALPQELRQMPALRPPADAHHLPLADHSDNSNTQFAALALWAAGRRGLPVERALALTAARFRFSQSVSGGWDYHYAVPSHASTPSMTCAGLLGLAVGHGLVVRHRSHPTHSARVDDDAARRGMDALAGFLGEPREYAGKKDRPPINLYYLWSLGRVGLLYQARKIGGKDSYAWGVNQVLAWQEPDGSWKANVYPDAAPVINTCFALLFLRRSDLARDLSQSLEFRLIEKKPDQDVGR